MRAAAVLAILSLTLSTSAQHRYIVPVSGNARTDALYLGNALVINPGPGPATVAVEEIFRSPGALPCSPTPPGTIPAGDYRSVGAALIDPLCTGILALVLSSDRPVVVRASITSIALALPGQPEMRVDVADRWVEPGETALIARIPIRGAFRQRANVILVNPEEREIEVRMHLTHVEFGSPREDIVRVPARSVILQPLLEIADPRPPTGFPQAAIAEHDLVLSANGKFQAGAASIQQSGIGTYRGAVILSP